MMTRAHGICGRRPPKNAPALDMAKYLTAVIPHPGAEDYIAALGGGWQMLGNDRAGDCVSVTWANIRRMVTKVLGGTERYPTQAEVWALYRTQNPDFDPNGSADTNGPGSQADQGMDIQTVLEYLVKTGGPDGVKAVAFGKIKPSNTDAVKAAIAIFGTVWTGINVLDVNMSEFDADQPWDYDASSPVDGGHSIVTGGYGPAGTGALGGDERFVTWAAETSFTDRFWTNETEEVWVVIWPEHLGTAEFMAGVDQAALAADYTALTGKPFPVTPTPAPTPDPVPPVPAPTPVPDPPVVDAADSALAAVAEPWCEERHVGRNETMKLALETWLAVKGLGQG